MKAIYCGLMIVYLMSPWKISAEVKKATLSKNKSGTLKPIGGGSGGNIFVGRVWFGRKPVRVAIKVFHSPISDEKAEQHNQAIAKLQAAGVRLPKIGMIKMQTPFGLEWIQVSQLFGSTKHSKLVNKSHLEIQGVQNKLEALEELTKVANAGFVPSADIIEPFKRNEKGVIPIDINYMITETEELNKNPRLENRQIVLACNLYNIIRRLKFEKNEVSMAVEKCLNTAKPEFKPYIEKWVKERILVRAQ